MSLPEVRFFVSGRSKQVSTESPLWKRLLLGQDYPQENESNHLFDDTTIGEFLLCAEEFIRIDDFSLIKKAVDSLLNTGHQVPQIKAVDLILEKHGKFYHPIRTRVFLDDGSSCSLVLNGAVSSHGRAMAKKEYGLISALSSTSDVGLPKVFGCRSVRRHHKAATFFMGQWLEGFHEFHLTRDRQKNEVVIWEADGGKKYERTEALYTAYGQMSSILTTCYDVESFCQVYPWHHAAGDFIIRKKGDRYQAKLICVRGYENFTDFEKENASDRRFVLPALLFFFLNLTLRMRLDRLNGTGDAALVDEEVIPFVIRGFLDGLEKKSAGRNNIELKEAFIEFAGAFSLTRMLEIMVNILGDFPPSSFEINLIRQGLEAHFQRVAAFFKTI